MSKGKHPLPKNPTWADISVDFDYNVVVDYPATGLSDNDRKNFVEAKKRLRYLDQRKFAKAMAIFVSDTRVELSLGERIMAIGSILKDEVGKLKDMNIAVFESSCNEIIKMGGEIIESGQEDVVRESLAQFNAWYSNLCLTFFVRGLYQRNYFSRLSTQFSCLTESVKEIKEQCINEQKRVLKLSTQYYHDESNKECEEFYDFSLGSVGVCSYNPSFQEMTPEGVQDNSSSDHAASPSPIVNSPIILPNNSPKKKNLSEVTSEDEYMGDLNSDMVDSLVRSEKRHLEPSSSSSSLQEQPGEESNKTLPSILLSASASALFGGFNYLKEASKGSMVD